MAVVDGMEKQEQEQEKMEEAVEGVGESGEGKDGGRGVAAATDICGHLRTALSLSFADSSLSLICGQQFHAAGDGGTALGVMVQLGVAGRKGPGAR